MNNEAQNKAIHAKVESSKNSGPVAIHYHKKNVYGNENKYVTNPEIAHHVSRLTGQKTLSDQHISAFQSLGHEVKHVPQN